MPQGGATKGGAWRCAERRLGGAIRVSDLTAVGGGSHAQVRHRRRQLPEFCLGWRSLSQRVPKPAPSGSFATFNASLNRNFEGQLVGDLSTTTNAQARAVAEIIQRTRPDVLLINEFDFVEDGQAAELFRDNYLSVGQMGADPIDYPYYYVAPSNTSIPSGFDLNNNGVVGGPDDAFGFGFFPGQFGMVVFSRYPIDTDAVRTFQMFLCARHARRAPPGRPLHPEPADWYSQEELEVFRLSSKKSLGRAHPGRRPGGPLSGQPSHAAGLRRSGGRGGRRATTMRSGCGPTTSLPARRPTTSMTTTASTAA